MNKTPMYALILFFAVTAALFAGRAEELSDKGQRLERDPALTAEDSKRMQALASRFQKAMEIIARKMR